MLLDFPHYADYSASNFLEMPCNTQALAAIKKFPEENGAVLVIYGPKGCGKTHLLHIWAQRTGGLVLSSSQLIKEGLFNESQVAVDNLEVANHEQQENLFHLFNYLKSSGGALLVASEQPVAQMNLIPEIQSRLLTAPQIEMLEAEESGLQMLLVKWAHERQITLDPTVLNYLLTRCQRNMSHLASMIEMLDKLSLEQKRKITIPLVKEALKIS